MGTNKRYAARIDREQAIKTDQLLMRDGKPESLTTSELELDQQPLTRTPVPVPARAWVHYGRWTPRACAVRWTTAAGDEHRAWVWASAVERG